MALDGHTRAVTLVDNTGTPIGANGKIGTSAAPQSPVTLYNPGTQTLTASGQSANIATAGVSALFLSVVVGGATGTSPTLAVAYDQQDAAGNWILGLATLATLTAAGQQSATFGVGIAGAAAAVLPSGVARVRWTVGGTTPSFTGVYLSLIGL